MATPRGPGRPKSSNAKKLTSLRLPPQVRDWYDKTMGGKYGPVAYVVEAWPALYESTLAAIREAGIFSRQDALAMLQALQGTLLTPGMAGQQIAADVADSEGEHAELVAELEQLPRAALAVLELWATAPAEDLEAHLALVVGR
ncbi:MAG: hypothetical protein WC642_08455 [Nocardioides sp.]|jgi:hypothetical protein